MTVTFASMARVNHAHRVRMIPARTRRGTREVVELENPGQYVPLRCPAAQYAALSFAPHGLTVETDDGNVYHFEYPGLRLPPANEDNYLQLCRVYNERDNIDRAFTGAELTGGIVRVGEPIEIPHLSTRPVMRIFAHTGRRG